MKLSKLQRYTVYCIMLHEAENRDDYEYNFGRPYYLGLCAIIGKNLDSSDFIEKDSDMKYKRDLPELADKETCDIIGAFGHRYYFKTWRERIAALKQCIKETEPQNSPIH